MYESMCVCVRECVYTKLTFISEKEEAPGFRERTFRNKSVRKQGEEARTPHRNNEIGIYDIF